MTKRNKNSMLPWVKVALFAVAILVACAYSLFHVFQKESDMDSNYDIGIPVSELIDIIEPLVINNPNCSIVMVWKHYHSLSIQTESNQGDGNQQTFTFYKRHYWHELPPSNQNAKGISPAELIQVLKLISNTPNYVNKNVLSIEIDDWNIEITTGETNHSLGGSGNTLHYRKHKNGWKRISIGNWIS